MMNHSINNQNQSEKGSNLLRKIQEVDFSIYETVLFLDAYPNCHEALSYYHALLSQRKALMAQYEKDRGPLTAFGNQSQGSWDWVKTAWPWQM